MTPEEALVDITTRLGRLGVPFALVGGLAVSIRAEVRFTRDVDLAIARLRSPSGIVVDLLAASSGIEREIVEAARETSELPGIPVALPEHLLAMKVLSMRTARLQDRIDAANLLAAAPIDEKEVRRLLALIEERGFARGQDLAAKLDALLVETKGD